MEPHTAILVKLRLQPYVLASGAGTDIINDFTDNRDKLGLSGGLSFGQLSLAQGTGTNTNNTLISLASNDEVLAILRGVQANSITSADFVVI
ncbi:MAG: hypothetical protein MUD14_27470 [Hydrococcus sp. Prado102]|jgi:hypothetical protein|nr:hypothetical protein [Hydrococcus sp. Prado102]